MKTLLIDLGFTILGGPDKSPASFLGETLSWPPGDKNFLSDLVFCQTHTSAPALADALGRRLNRALSADEIKAVTAYWAGQIDQCLPLPGAADFCRQIMARDYPFHIVSNLWPPFHQALSYHLPEFERAAKGSWLSYKLGVRKPSAAFYDTVLAGIDINPRALIMIGDSWDKDIAPCLEQGLTAVWLASERCPDVLEIAARRAPEYPRGQLMAAGNYHDCLEILGDFFAGETR